MSVYIAYLMTLHWTEYYVELIGIWEQGCERSH